MTTKASPVLRSSIPGFTNSGPRVCPDKSAFKATLVAAPIVHGGKTPKVPITFINSSQRIQRSTFAPPSATKASLTVKTNPEAESSSPRKPVKDLIYFFEKMAEKDVTTAPYKQGSICPAPEKNMKTSVRVEAPPNDASSGSSAKTSSGEGSETFFLGNSNETPSDKRSSAVKDLKVNNGSSTADPTKSSVMTLDASLARMRSLAILSGIMKESLPYVRLALSSRKEPPDGASDTVTSKASSDKTPSTKETVAPQKDLDSVSANISVPLAPVYTDTADTAVNQTQLEESPHHHKKPSHSPEEVPSKENQDAVSASASSEYLAIAHPDTADEVHSSDAVPEETSPRHLKQKKKLPNVKAAISAVLQKVGLKKPNLKKPTITIQDHINPVLEPIIVDAIITLLLANNLWEFESSFRSAANKLWLDSAEERFKTKDLNPEAIQHIVDSFQLEAIDGCNLIALIKKICMNSSNPAKFRDTQLPALLERVLMSGQSAKEGRCGLDSAFKIHSSFPVSFFFWREDEDPDLRKLIFNPEQFFGKAPV